MKITGRAINHSPWLILGEWFHEVSKEMCKNVIKKESFANLGEWNIALPNYFWECARESESDHSPQNEKTGHPKVKFLTPCNIIADIF